MGIDNRKREKPQELIDLENDESIVDENDNPRRNYNAVDDKAAEENEDENDEEELEDKEKEDEKELDDEEEELNEEELDEEEKKVKKESKEEDKTDWKERHKQSTQEAQLLHERNKQLTDAFTKIDEVKEPTEEELQKAAKADGLEWEDLTPTEKLLLKKDYVNTQKLAAVHGAVKDVRNIDEWGEKVDEFIDTNDTKQTHKALIGKETAFRSFAMQSSHRGLPIEMLVSHFLMTSEPSAHRKGSMFLTNTGGERTKVKSGLDDADKAANLRISNPKEYKRLIKAGKINLDV